MRIVALPVMAIFFLLGACGGSSGGIEGPPPPPPPPPTNTTLTDLKYSQSFANDAASTKVAVDLTTKTGVSGTARQESLTISYDAAAKGYTVTVDGRSQSFGQADIQVSNAGEAIYQKTDGANRDYLTLVKIPYSGTTPTQYVGLGYWQRNVTAADRLNIDYATFTYGLPTAATAVPRTGTAGYSVDAFGVVSTPGQEPRTFDGRGAFSVDFGAGVFSTQAYLTEATLVTGNGVSGGGIELTAAGHLSASDGRFSGNVLYEGWFGFAGGQLSGRFYGPDAEELGASFAGGNAGGMAFTGSFTGQRDGTVRPENLTLTNLTQPQLFYTQFGYGLVGQLNRQDAETFTYGTPTSDLYGGQFTINDKIASADPNFTAYRKSFTGSSGSQDVALKLYKPGPGNTELALTYASFGHWSTSVPFGTGQSPVNQYFAYGLETPARLLSARTGTGRYTGVVYGTGSNFQAGTLYAVKGTSRFDVDFTAQSYSGALTMAGTSTTGGAGVDFGSFDFAGKFSPYVAGTTVSLMRGGQGVGQMDTRFFGPDGEEIAGPFSLNVPQGSAGAGISISGVTAAKRQ